MEMFRFMMESQRRDAAPHNQFGEFREIIGFARELLGASGGKRSGWETGLEIAKEVALPALNSIGGLITNIMALRNGGGGPQAAPGATPARPPAAFDPYRNPNAARAWAAQQPQPAPAPAPAPTPPSPQPAPSDIESALLQDMRQYGGLIVTHLNNNTAGFDFADYVAGLLGAGVVANISASGEPMLVRVMMQIPEIAIFGESRIKQFVNEFVHYQEFINAQAGDEEEGEEEGPIVDAPKFFTPRPPERATTSTGGKS
jgi:hypothetical protein